MGPMVRGRPTDRKRVVRWAGASFIVLFLWSFIAAPAAQTEEPAVVEPSGLLAYDASADASPIATLIDHQVALITLPPTIARASSEVSLPSQASSTAYLLDNGLANGLHGTTTGNSVPTEVTAAQPGGNAHDEFVLAEQPIGNDRTARVGAGVARATAEHSVRPRGYAHAYVGNLVLLPAPGSPDQPPGTYDPQSDAQKEHEDPTTFPVASGSPTPTKSSDDPRAYTPNPSGQMGILTVGSIASTSDSFREDGKVVSIAVAEINGVNLGNRTGDNRCTNCITIDWIRVEARAESDGSNDGEQKPVHAWWRLLIHRACRVSMANDGQGGAYEAVKCLDPDPDKLIELTSNHDEQNPEGFEEAIGDPDARGVRHVDSLDALNEMFAKGLGAGDFKTGDLGIRMFFGKHGSASTSLDGQTALAYAAGLEFQVTTAAQTKALGMFESSARAVEEPSQVPDVPVPSQRPAPWPSPLPPSASPQPVPAPSRAPRSGGEAIDAGDDACQNAQGLNGENSSVAVPCANGAIDKAKLLRTVSITLGAVRVQAVARPGSIGGGGGTTGPTTPGYPAINIPSINIPSFNIPAGSGGSTYVVGGGIGSGALKLKVDWSSVRLKLWSKQDQAKAWFTALLSFAMVALIRRRLRARA